MNFHLPQDPKIDPLCGLSEKFPANASPKILFIDDDPLLCKKMERKAKSVNIQLTACKSLGEVMKISQAPEFDVAILDYFFGDLTAFQLSHFLKANTPIILISNKNSEELSKEHWPPEIRRFVHKEAGLDAILAEALFTSHWSREVSLLPPTSEPQTKMEIIPEIWAIAFATALLAAAGLGLLFSLQSRSPWNPWM